MVNNRAPIIVDGLVLAECLDPSGASHSVCRGILDAAQGPFVVPWPCATEAALILEGRGLHHTSAAAALADGLAFGRLEDFVPVAPGLWDLLRIQELQHEFEELGLGFVEASVAAVAERMGATVLVTFDSRNAAIVPKHVEVQIVPRLT